MKADVARWFLAGLALTVAYLGLLLLRPVAAPLAAAAFVAICLYPLHSRLARELPVSPAASAALSTVLATLSVALPAFAAVWLAADQAASALPAARGLFASLPATWLRIPLVESLTGAQLRGALQDNAETLIPMISSSISALARGAGTVTGFLFVFPLALFLFLKDGRALLTRSLDLLPLPGAMKDALSGDLQAAMGAAARSLFAVALVQSALATAGFLFFGVPYALLLGLLCAALSPIPFVGTAVVWVPVVLRLWIGGETLAASALGVWCLVIVGLADNVVRPFILRAGTRVPLPVLVIALVAGVQAFGLAGALAGPFFACAVLAIERASRPLRR